MLFRRKETCVVIQRKSKQTAQDAFEDYNALEKFPQKHGMSIYDNDIFFGAGKGESRK